MKKIAYYITAHGYGHGTRSCDIINALHGAAPEVPIVVKTDLPLAFMQSHLPDAIRIVPGAFDVGLVQKDSIQVDLEASLKAVELVYANESRLIEGEMEFIDRIPHSDDPTQGFVGNINGAMGQLPPDDYGVYAGPVAELLREYGLNAFAVSGWDIQAIKKEIAAGRPVIAWIVNLPFAIETSQYTASNGNTITAARFEHTWIITGYNAYTFTVIDSEWTYNVKTSTFIERWNALGNQAIILNSD